MSSFQGIWIRLFCDFLFLKALEDLRVEGVAVFSRPQGVFSLCERADLLGPAWDLDHSSVEVGRNECTEYEVLLDSGSVMYWLRWSLLERCPHFRGCYVEASMELGPEDVSLLEWCPHFRGYFCCRCNRRHCCLWLWSIK